MTQLHSNNVVSISDVNIVQEIASISSATLTGIVEALVDVAADLVVASVETANNVSVKIVKKKRFQFLKKLLSKFKLKKK